MPISHGVGLIGYGGIGRMHALCYRMLPLAYPNLPAMARIVAVATRSADSAARAQRELGNGVQVTTELEALLGNPQVTLVDCCTPTDDHLRTATAALRAGNILFCEKPLGASAGESAQIVALAHERGLRGGLNFHFRQIPAIQEARRRIDAGLLGDVTGFHLRYYRASNLQRTRPLTWRFKGAGSGVLVDLGSHLIDLVLHLLGPITTVAAHTRTLIPERPGPDGQMQAISSDDAAWLRLQLAGGGLGTIEASKVVPGAADDIRVEAYGSGGTLMIDTRDPNHLYIANEQGGQHIATFSRTTPAASLPGAEMATGSVQWHLSSIAAFLDALGRDIAPEPSLEAGLAVDRVIGAAFESARQGGVDVSIQ